MDWTRPEKHIIYVIQIFIITVTLQLICVNLRVMQVHGYFENYLFVRRDGIKMQKGSVSLEMLIKYSKSTR